MQNEYEAAKEAAQILQTVEVGVSFDGMRDLGPDLESKTVDIVLGLKRHNLDYLGLMIVHQLPLLKETILSAGASAGDFKKFQTRPQIIGLMNASELVDEQDPVVYMEKLTEGSPHSRSLLEDYVRIQSEMSPSVYFPNIKNDLAKDFNNARISISLDRLYIVAPFLGELFLKNDVERAGIVRKIFEGDMHFHHATEPDILFPAKRKNYNAVVGAMRDVGKRGGGTDTMDDIPPPGYDPLK